MAAQTGERYSRTQQGGFCVLVWYMPMRGTDNARGSLFVLKAAVVGCTMAMLCHARAYVERRLREMMENPSTAVGKSATLHCVCHANNTSFSRTDAPPAVLPAGKLAGLRGKRPDSAPNPLLWLLWWYILSAASATAVLLLWTLTPAHTTLSRRPPRVGQAAHVCSGGISLMAVTDRSSNRHLPRRRPNGGLTCFVPS